MKYPKLLFVLIFSLIISLSCSNNQSPVTNLPSNVIIVYGDTRTNHSVHREVVRDILKLNPVMAFHTGDLVADGLDPADWDAFNDINTPLEEVAEFYPVLGSHERASAFYFDRFELPNNERWYSVDKYNIHFIMLDTESDISEGSEQYNWLENNLQNVPAETQFTLVFCHEPPYTTSSHPENVIIRDTVAPSLFEPYGVDMVFSGHNHCYERSSKNGISYIVTGGGGAPIYGRARTSSFSEKFVKAYHFCSIERGASSLTMKVFDINLKIIDQIKITI